jgi:glycosyltransferase involved in cell wall biosynthesis
MPDERVDTAPELPMVSIIVPVFNGAATIGKCVASFLALDYPRDRLEILIVDNGSTDGTAERLRAFGDRIRVLHESTRGAGAARNRGIREARGTVVAFTDADGTVDAGWLAAIVQPLRDPTVGIACGPVLSRRPCNRIELFGERIHDQRSAIAQRIPYVASGNWASPRALLIDVGLFDEALLRGQDVDLSWRVGYAGYRFAYAAHARVYHRNERSLRGLVREGFVHGFNGVRLRDKHAALGAPAGAGRRSNAYRRLYWDLQRLARDDDRMNHLLRLVFDLGKSAGELWALARMPRRQSHARAEAPVAAAVRQGEP